MSGALRYYVRFLPSVVLWECARCGLKLNARRTDGTSVLGFEIHLVQPSLSRSKHSAVLTLDGKLSILCGSDISVDVASEDSGRSDGISSSPKNSAKTQREAIHTADEWRLIDMTFYGHAQVCGCDPVADHMCSVHEATVNAIKPRE